MGPSLDRGPKSHLNLNPIRGGTKCPDPFHIAIAVFFLVGNVFFLLFGFYYFEVRQFLVKKTPKFFTPPPSEGVLEKQKKNLPRLRSPGLIGLKWLRYIIKMEVSELAMAFLGD